MDLQIAELLSNDQIVGLVFGSVIILFFKFGDNIRTLIHKKDKDESSLNIRAIVNVVVYLSFWAIIIYISIQTHLHPEKSGMPLVFFGTISSLIPQAFIEWTRARNNEEEVEEYSKKYIKANDIIANFAATNIQLRLLTPFVNDPAQTYDSLKERVDKESAKYRKDGVINNDNSDKYNLTIEMVLDNLRRFKP